MASQGDILLVGSIPLESSQAVFRELGAHIGARAARYPDGETGIRTNWIRWQRHIFANNSAFERADVEPVLPGYEGEPTRPYFRLRNGIDASEIAFAPLGFASTAAQSFAEFLHLRNEGAVPQGIRFQVSIPTPVAILTGFLAMEDRSRVEPLLELAMQREVSEITKTIPHADVSIQWDVAHEVIAADGGMRLHFSDLFDGTIERLIRLCDAIPPDVEIGVHLCYGDLGHRHLVQPKSAMTCTKFSNAICAKMPRPVNWIHMPVPRDRKDDAFFEPLRELQVPEITEFYLGLVHATDGIDGTAQRIATAKKSLGSFGISTECGFGRRDPANIPQLLNLHVAAANLL
jgi:hypothetical protein